MTKQLAKIEWPTAITMIVVVLTVGAAYLFGPALGVSEDAHSQLVAGIGAVGSILLAAMRGLLDRKEAQ